MKTLWAIAITFVFVASAVQWVPPAAAQDASATAATAPDSKAGTAVDCSKEVWPQFSPPCLRNANHASPVRLITADRH